MSKIFLRVIFFVILIFLGLSGPVWVFLLASILYTFVYVGVEIILLGMLIDAYFGFDRNILFMYTIGASILVFVLQWVKPRLSVYNQ